MRNIILEVINNDKGYYEGNLRHYARIAFKAPSADNDYHNFRHDCHAACSGYEAAILMQFHKKYGKRLFRALLIALMWHDLWHSGRMGDDAAEVKRALKKARLHLLKKDLDLWPFIKIFIGSTQYPHVPVPTLGASYASYLNEGIVIMRDADMSQLFSPVWIQQIIFGLAAEMGITPTVMLKRQIGFIASLRFKTAWGKRKFNKRVIAQKLLEIKEWIKIIK